MDMDKPKIPLPVFRKMVRAMTPSELAELPPEQLPARIPVAFLESLPEETSAAIDELILAQQIEILHSRKTLTKTYGSEVARAITLSQRSLEGMAVGELRRKLVRVRNRRTAHAKKLNINLAMELLELLESSHDLVNQLMDDHRRVIEARQNLRAELFRLPSSNDELQYADQELATQSKEMCSLAGHYYAERCDLCLVVMRGYQQLQTRHSGLKQAISHRVKTLTEYPNVTGEDINHQDGRQLHNEVRSLFGKMRDHDFVVDESELTYWLDIVLEFSLFRRKKSRYEVLVSKAETTLSTFVQQYSKRIEESHNEIQANRYAPVPVERGDAFELSGREFLKTYFERRLKELSHQTCIPATDRLYALRRVQRVLN